MKKITVILFLILILAGCKKDDSHSTSCLPSQTIEDFQGIKSVTTYDAKGRKSHFSREASQTSIPAVEEDYFYGTDGQLVRTVEFSTYPLGLDYHLCYDTITAIYHYYPDGKLAKTNKHKIKDKGNNTFWVYDTEETYEYDERGNLIKHKITDPQFGDKYTELFYDEYNNLVQVLDYPAGVVRYKNTYNELGQLIKVVKTDNITSISTTEYTYDEEGNNIMRVTTTKYAVGQIITNYFYAFNHILLFESTQSYFGPNSKPDKTVTYMYNCP